MPESCWESKSCWVARASLVRASFLFGGVDRYKSRYEKSRTKRLGTAISSRLRNPDARLARPSPGLLAPVPAAKLSAAGQEVRRAQLHALLMEVAALLAQLLGDLVRVDVVLVDDLA